MLLKKLLSFIFFINDNSNDKDNVIYKMKNLKDIIENQTSGIKELILLKETITKHPVSLDSLNFIDRCTKVSFYSTSSQGALEAVRKGHYNKETINNSKLISSRLMSTPFNSWYSSRESVDFFIIFMKDMINKSINLEQPINQEDYLKGIGVVTQEEENFINSLLYQLLLSDFLTLIILLMENENVEIRK